MLNCKEMTEYRPIVFLFMWMILSCKWCLPIELKLLFFFHFWRSKAADTSPPRQHHLLRVDLSFLYWPPITTSWSPWASRVHQQRTPDRGRMERVQHMTRSAIRRASNIEINPQTKRNLQELFVNFSLILICLLLIYIIVLLMWRPHIPVTCASRWTQNIKPGHRLDRGINMWRVFVCVWERGDGGVGEIRVSSALAAENF